MDYFLVRNLGYDGLLLQRFRTKEGALKGYASDLDDVHRDKAEYGDNANKGIILIEGSVIASEDEMDIFPFDD